MLNTRQKINLFIIIIFLFCFTAPCFAAYDFVNKSGLQNTGTKAGYDVEEQGEFTYLPSYVGIIIGAVLGLIGAFFLVLMIYGGYMWMTARGNEEQVTKAKEIIIRNLIGLIIILGAFGIYTLVSRIFIYYLLPVKSL